MAGLTWEDTKWYNIEKSIAGRKVNNSLEIDLFRQMLSKIPDSYEGSLDSWASVIVGFESYSRQKAILHTAGKIDEFETTVFGSRGLDPRSWLSVGSNSYSAHSSSGVIPTYVQAFVLIKNKPQIFNQLYYETAFGKPPKPWSSYYPGLKVE